MQVSLIFIVIFFNLSCESKEKLKLGTLLQVSKRWYSRLWLIIFVTHCGTDSSEYL